MIFKGVEIRRKQYFIAIMMDLERKMEAVQGKPFCETHQIFMDLLHLPPGELLKGTFRKLYVC